MRETLNTLLSNTVTLRYVLPNETASIPKVIVTNVPDECYGVITNIADVASVIYNGIVEYSFDESDIDLTRLDVFQKRALLTKLKFDRKAEPETQLKYGFYGEILLFLMLQKFHHAGTFISRGLFYNPLDKRETTGYDTYQMLLNPDKSVELWFGEVKFHQDYHQAVRQILDKISLSLSDDYFKDNIMAMESKETYINTDAGISPILQAFRDEPDVNIAKLASMQGLSFVYPMLVIFDDNNKSYDQIIKDVVSYTNTKYNELDIKFSLEYSLFFMFLPVSKVHEIKEQVRQWILSNQPLI